MRTNIYFLGGKSYNITRLASTHCASAELFLPHIARVNVSQFEGRKIRLRCFSVCDKLAIVFICRQEEGRLFSGGRKTSFFYIRSRTLREALRLRCVFADERLDGFMMLYVRKIFFQKTLICFGFKMIYYSSEISFRLEFLLLF